jgi:hypothetical protein
MATSSRSSLPASTSNVITVASSATGGSTSDGAAGSIGTGTGSPCAACKFLRRKCQPDCVFAPYFPPDNPQKFVHVHRVFGASNVTKILNDLHPRQREDAVNSLAYEADMRLRDPIYGCVGVISVLQHRLRQLQEEVHRISYELAKYKVLYTRVRSFRCSLTNLSADCRHKCARVDVYTCSDEYASGVSAGCGRAGGGGFCCRRGIQLWAGTDGGFRR